MSVGSVVCCTGRGLCDALTTRPEETYQLWCVVVCDLETSRMRRPWPALGRRVTGKLLLLLLITFMQGIYNCIPETNHVSRV